MPFTEIVVEERASFDASAEAVWELVLSPRGYALFSGFGPIPGLTKIVWQDGDESVEGSVARAHNTDGSHHRERVLRSARPHDYEIVIDEFDSVFRHVVREAREVIELRAEGEATHLRRRFIFELTTALVAPVASTLLRWLFRRALKRHHAALDTELRGAGRAGSS